MSKNYWQTWLSGPSYDTKRGAQTAARNMSKNKIADGSYRITEKIKRNRKGQAYDKQFNLWFIMKTLK